VSVFTKVTVLNLLNNKTDTELRQELRQQVLNFQPDQFEDLALQIFRYQAHFNPVYNQYVTYLKKDVNRVERLTEVPFLPIQFFKNHLIRTGQPPGVDAPSVDAPGVDAPGVDTPTTSVTFESSGTSGTATSRHVLYDASLYQSVSTRIFEQLYGRLSDYHILALLPSYLERNNSSLVYMIRRFIDQTCSPVSNFYLNNTDQMLQQLRHLSENPDGKPVLMMGVTFALLDLAESGTDFSFLKNIPSLSVMDTGGMKGRRPELLREEVHDILTARFGVSKIHSEYGMTELLSQGYSSGDGLFIPGHTMRILLREINDPFSIADHTAEFTRTGGINVIDLANLDSCSFIETQDLGRFGTGKGTFYIMGRFDNSDVRGCNLMVL
jgi:phenylacetate-coenzyme A ligase PaaK-like adenylate-forming protein